ncbi:MAG: YfbM family protein [Micropepsaceae bacterium]
MSMNLSMKQASELELARMAREGVDEDVLMGAGDALELDKSWHVLHYLFTGKAWDGPLPAAALLSGGREVGEDLGYGPARVLSAKETQAFAQYLGAQSEAALVKKLNVPKMQSMDIYCADDDAQEDLNHYFPQLKSYVSDAAAKGQGLLIWMS